jgi:hypothetical protein
MLQFDHRFDGVFGQNFRRVLVGQIVATFDSIVSVPEGLIFFKVAQPWLA